MMKRVLSCLFILVASSVCAGPRIYCFSPNWDFGAQFNGGKLVHEYVVENRGDEPLLFGKLKNCCGMTVDFPCKTLAPGSNAVCRATFNTAGRRGEQVKEIYLASNDRKHPYLILKMQGVLRESLEIEPRFIRYSMAEPQALQTVRLNSASGVPFSIINLTSSIDGIVVTKKQLTPQEWELAVQLAPDFPGGKVRGRVTLLTDHPDHPKIYISLMGEVAASLKVVPSEIIMVQGTDPVIRYVAVRSKEPLNNLSAQLTGCSGTITQERVSDGNWRITLKVDPASISAAGLLVITTDHPRRPKLSVPVRLVELDE